jgi:lysophospholipase L1-like esterase
MRLLCLALAASMALAAEGMAQAPQPKPAPAAAESAEAALLAPFHRALSELEAGKRQRVVVLQLGDSHTHADHFSQALRERLQSRFGDAGRGHMPTGYSWPDYKPYGARIHKTGSWILMNARRVDDAGPFGIAGFRLVGNSAVESITLEADLPFDEAEIEILAQPGGGSLVVSVDGVALVEVATAAGTQHMRRAPLMLDRPGQSLSISPRGNGPVELLGWSIWQRQRGVALVSHGVSGATAGIMERFDPAIAAQEVALLDPALVIIAFGTNEGFSMTFQPDAYRQEFAALLAQWRRIAPQAALVVVGPPNALRVPDFCGSAEQRDRMACAAPPAPTAAAYYGLLSQRSRMLCRWHEPGPQIEARAIQRQEAARAKALFWDWSQIPAAPCGMDTWAKQNPPFVHKDRVHMRPEGYKLGGDALYKELMRSYRPR